MHRKCDENDYMWHFVYILKNQQGKQYVGHSLNLHKRLLEHNEGSVSATKMGKPWRIEWFCAFRTSRQAIAFEKHLKGGSGSAFRFKHFVPKEIPDVGDASSQQENGNMHHNDQINVEIEADMLRWRLARERATSLISHEKASKEYH